MTTLHLYSFFHLNLAYSAIEEQDRAAVIQRCYWPLLDIAAKLDLPLGIEASAYTLETAAELDPAWIAELRRLVQDGPCELIGCGYAQVIGPLVPAAVNVANLRLGMQSYERLLGFRPKIALVNEQAYAAGLVPQYLEAGYRALIMEWNNPARTRSDWETGWRYLPQYACGPEGETIPLIWNKSIAFQKFQRYVHGEMDLDEYLGYLRSHLTDQERAFPLYGNDVEVFDFRPGRYMTEAPLHGEGEWCRIESMLTLLRTDSNVCFIRPSEVLDLLDRPGAGHRLRLESPTQPIPVKKQDKYNPLRWAVTGRGDTAINTRCWQIFAALQRSDKANDDDWRELCYLWSSDFRTHITDARWSAYRQRQERLAKHWQAGPRTRQQPTCAAMPPNADHTLRIERHGSYLQLEGERLRVRLNCHRGLALDRLVDRACGEEILCGTLHYGYFDDIQWGADYYTGHLVFESPGCAKVTDLNPVEPVIEHGSGWARIGARVNTPLGLVEKSWTIDDTEGSVTLEYHILWDRAGLGSLRLGHITLMPDAFDADTLFYSTHNGGRAAETFTLAGADMDHGRAVSFLVSANQTIGITEGVVELGDAHRCIRVEIDKTQTALVGLITHRKVDNRYFYRLSLSARELDDTCRLTEAGSLSCDIAVKITASQKSQSSQS